MKKEKVDFTKINERESFWRFNYLEKSSMELMEQYQSEFRNTLCSEGILSQNNLLVNTGNYRKEFWMNDGDELSISASRYFTDVYSFEGSYLIEEGEYKNGFRKEGKLTEGNELEITLFLKTPRNYFSKLKHDFLEGKLNGILRR